MLTFGENSLKFAICTFPVAGMTNSWAPWSFLNSTATIEGKWARQLCCHCHDGASTRSAKAIAANDKGCLTTVGHSVRTCRGSFAEGSYRYDSAARGGH